jgi:hypothetical protein
MADKFLIKLNDDWAILYDDLQWIIASKRTRKGKEAWRAEMFIASSKLVLIRVIDDLGITPTREAQHLLDQLPDTFKKWLKLKVFMETRMRPQRVHLFSDHIQRELFNKITIHKLHQFRVRSKTDGKGQEQ